MPELPEVETVVRSVEPHLRGRTIVRAELSSKRVTRQPFEEAERGLTGATIVGISRRGKQIFIHLDRGILYVHLGMTGALLWNAQRDKFTRALLELDSGTLVFRDIRQFGRFEFHPQPFELKAPDALTVEFEEFYTRLQRHRGPAKAVLLNQSFVAGVGNIYADEILFASRIHPRTAARRISRARAFVLHANTMRILAEAVELKGSSISDYVDAGGNKGNFQDLHRVYGRTGEPCPHCGSAIRRIVIGQRGTHYCPRCQRV